jgi:trans-aconitate 2-methyltransferase
MSWNPDQYLKFAGPRFRPAQDLLARIDADAPATVYDLGCGTGHITQMLAQRWPHARITGVDDSADMLSKARAESACIQWQQQSIADWSPNEPADIVYSNAALHWLGSHETLFPRIMQQLAKGGTLAVQMPRNFNARSHTLIEETVRSGPWAQQLTGLIRSSPVQEPDFYYDILAECASHIDIWETQYLQALTGTNPVKEWTKGTWLKPFLDALDEPERQAFENDYAQRVAQVYPTRPDGITLFPFRRLFIIARKR